MAVEILDQATGRVASGSPPEVFSTIQVSRGVAALLVLLFHIGGSIFALEKYWGVDPTHGAFDFGRAGVDFFFVLSGFIILHVHRHDFGRKARLQNYLTRRFIRIYPIYWLVLAVLIPAYFVAPSSGHGHERDLSIIASSILLLHFNTELTVLTVAWTLYHEILFYVVFAIAIWHRTTGFLVMAVWLGVSLLALAVGDRSYPFGFVASPMHLLFAMGMGVCWLIHERRVKAPWLLVALGCTLFFGVGATESYGWSGLSADQRTQLYGFGSALTLAGLVTAEQQGRVRAWAPLCLLGDASYCIYLTHFALLSLVAKIFVACGARIFLPLPVSYLLVAFIVVGLGISIHLVIERPLIRGIGVRLRRPVTNSA